MNTTPEHDKRMGPDWHNSEVPIHPEVKAAYAYVDRVEETADACQCATGHLAWHGWALREAFLAGITLERKRTKDAEDELLAWGLRLYGFDLSYRRRGTDWPALWRVSLFATKNERDEYRSHAYGDSPEEAIIALVELIPK